MKKLLTLLASLSLVACAGMMSEGKTVNAKPGGAEEAPPAATAGSGAGGFTLPRDGSVRRSATTTGVQGPPGAKLNEAQIQAFRSGHLYVNVHSDRYKGGEVCAQLRP